MPWFALLIFALASGLHGEGTLSSASLSASFENTLASARTAGMGGALYFSDGDSSLLIQNPAALSAARLPQISLHHNSWIGDIMQELVVLALPVFDEKDKSALGITVNYVNYGRFQGRDETGRLTTPLGASDIGLGMAFGRKLLGVVSGGFSFKTMQQTLADKSYSTYSADFGLLIEPHPWLTFSAAYAGLGSAIGGSQRATVIRLGVSALTGLTQEAGFRVGLGVDLKPLGRNQANLGAEFELSRMFSMRAGYSLPLQTLEIDGLKNFTVGAGFRVEPVSVDYAYQPYGELGNVQRISVAYAFSNPSPTTPRPASIQAQATPLPAPPLPLAPAPVGTATPSAPPNRTENSLEFVVKVADKELQMARELEAEGNHKMSIEAYSLAIQKSPEDAVAWRELADLYFKLGKRDFALRCYEEVVKLKPENIELRNWIEKVRGKIE